MITESNDPKPVGLIVPHTHWDREWRYPIWKNRALLVKFMSELLDILDRDSDYTCFVMDGQVVAIIDYLEVCPENRERVERHVQEGRLKVGPWYTLPDLYPLDGECLVRNLLKGIRECRKLGGHMGIGYNSFGWGQIAQFPQIYSGFGIDFVIAAKRVSKERALNCEFLWEGPDGTRLLASRLGKDARANGFFQMYIPVRHGVDYRGPDYRWEWGKTGSAMHRADSPHADQDYFRIDEASGYFPEKLKNAAEEAWEAMDETLVGDFRLILTGSDFSSPLPELTRMIRDARSAHPDKDIRMGTLEEYAGELKKRLDPARVPVVEGELRDGPAFACSGNALATRIYIKQLNKMVENSLIRQTEPLASALALMGEPYPESLVSLAWKHALEAHPHDSINGVTQDKTANDTVYRLEQALELSEVIFEESVQKLIGRMDLSDYADGDKLILLINTNPFPVRKIVELYVDIPQEENMWEIELKEHDGTPLTCQQLSRRESTSPVHDAESRPWPFHHDRHHVLADSGQVPAGGFKIIKVEARQTFDRNMEWWPEMRTSSGTDIARDPTTLENAHLAVSVSGDGRISLLDKANDTLFTDLHWFEDTGDVGDYWAYYPPYDNKTYTSKGTPAKVWLEKNGPLSATICVELEMQVPKGAHHAECGIRGESSRKRGTVGIQISSRITLTRDSRHLDFHTEIQNTAEDHRMRLMFPTNLKANSAQSGGHFMVNSRPHISPMNPEGDFWPEMQTLPQHMFVDISDGSKGLAILNDCFTEYQLLDDEKRTLAMTLFRSVRNRICTEFRSSGNFPHQKGGQCLRKLEYHYSICPHSGGWKEGGIYTGAVAFNTPLSAFQISPHFNKAGDLQPECSLFSIEGPELVLSAFKQSEEGDSQIIRVFNPTDKKVDGIIKFRAKGFTAWLVNLNESRIEEIPNQGGEIKIQVGPFKIATLEMKCPSP